MAGVEEACYTGLCLGLGLDAYDNYRNSDEKPKIEGGILKPSCKRRDNSYMVSLGLSFSVCSDDDADMHEDDEDRMAIDDVVKHAKGSKTRRANAMSNVQDENNPDGCRKKLRLSKEQAALLEESFKLHRALAPAQKQALADQLNLKPRQVEVWFQNRRARSKLKQTEIDFERLKKKCENLSNRNQRLEKELHDLRSVKDERKSVCNDVPGSSPTSFLLCSSCQKIVGTGEGK